jgi:RNA polymerase sigma-70 factor (ECF subfamily)
VDYTSQPARPKATGALLHLPLFAGDDAALVHGLSTGNLAAKAAFFSRFAPDVERLITHLIGVDRELADLLQEVFAQALSSVHSLRDPNALKPWLLRIATNCARRLLRSRSRRAWLRLFVDAEEEAGREQMASGSDPVARETLRAVYAILNRMPADERIAFALRYIEGMELTEAAAACSVSLATIKRRLGRAELRFRSSALADPLLEKWVKEGSRWQDR